MSEFCLLADPTNYRPHNCDLLDGEAHRKHWLDLFDNHFKVTLDHAAEHYGRPAVNRISESGEQFAAAIERLRRDPTSQPSGELSVMELCKLRLKCLLDHGLIDPFKKIKDRENASAIELYHQVVHKLHALNGRDKWLHLIESVFAGNIFDLGSSATLHLAAAPTDFLTTLDNIHPRPWCVDDFDRLAEDLPDSPPSKWAKAVVFIDNAGSDFILGVMPLVRELALGGTEIVLAANELPALNDMTAEETVELLPALAARDDDLTALIKLGMFEVVSTGNDIPLIDLSDVSDELNAAAADADLVILIGMGRGIESNFDTAFSVDALSLAMLKDPAVAAELGGELFDCVCKYTPIA